MWGRDGVVGEGFVGGERGEGELWGKEGGGVGCGGVGRVGMAAEGEVWWCSEEEWWAWGRWGWGGEDGEGEGKCRGWEG